MAIQDIATTLFFELQDTELVNGIKLDEIDKPLDEFMNKEGMTAQQKSKLLDIFTNTSCYCERRGFEQGLKLGLRLMAAAINGTSS